MHLSSRFTLVVSFFAAIVSLGSYATAQAISGGPRLIETDSGRQWMTPEQVQELARRMHAEGRCPGFVDVTNHQMPAVVQPNFLYLRVREPKEHATVNKLLPLLSEKRILRTVKTLSAFQNRYYDNDLGVAAAAWIKDTFVKHKGKRKDIDVQYFNHEFRQPSVIARFEGKDFPNEKVIVGAHEDSVNWEFGGLSMGDVAPGADDNASGVAVVLEAFRVLSANDFRPSRTVEFITYAGEELGLLGSQDIADAYREAGEKVVGVMQFDMTMFPTKARKISLITDNVDKPLTSFTGRLIDSYIKTPWQRTSSGYACSDHASWDRNGYPAVFPFEAAFSDSNPAIHSENDTLDNDLDASYAVQFAKLATAFVVELAEP